MKWNLELLVLLGFLGSSGAATAQVRPEELRCEYRVNPSGIDVVVPRLSWVITDQDAKARGARQSAYRVVVASTAEDLAAGKGDLWDSGKVNSGQSIHVAYAGKALASGGQAFWKVQVWDQDGRQSAWSAPASWSAGLLSPDDWKAKWIGLDQESVYKDPRSPFRQLEEARWIWASGDGPRNFTAKLSIPAGRVVASAECVVGADSGFELSLNGAPVGRGTTVQSPEVWDVKRFLKAGDNEILVAAKPARRGQSGLIGAFRVTFRQGDPLIVRTDRNWTAEGAEVQDVGAYGMAPWGEVGYAEERALPARMLRKEFEARAGVKRATAYVSGLGLSEMYLNGRKVGDHVLSPNLTEYDKRVFYVTFDVTRQVAQGKNAVGLMLGNGRYWAMRKTVPTRMRSYGYPKARLQVNIEYQDGRTDRVATDESWKLTTEGPIRANNEYDGEEYDARAESPGWDRAGFDDSKWQPARLVDGPSGAMVAQMSEPLRVMETIKPVKVTNPRPGVYIFDLGQNMVGWCRLHVTGARGAEVTLRHAETLRDNGELYLDNLRSARATDLYILRGGGPEVWEPRFTYHGFRYVEVTGYPGKPTEAAIEGRVVHDAMPQIADFTSSNDLLNRIHQNILRGVRGNYRSIPTDCPQRDERQGWLGDRSVVSRSESYLFDVAAFYSKWETDLADSQRDSGSIPDVAPAYWPMYNDDVTWPSTFVQIPVMLYDQYGDLRVIERNFGPIKKWIDHMRGFVKEGLMPKDTYGDWCVPPEDPKLIHSQDPARKTDGTLLATAYYYLMLRQVARFGRLIGKESDAAEYDTLADEMKAAFHTKFFNPATGMYSNGTQTSGILPLAFGMTPAENRKSVFEGLIGNIENVSKGHVGTGLVGAQWLMRALTENGRADVAYEIATQTTYPGLGYMASKGATTVWELWNGDTADPAMNSGNHVMQIGDMGVWMYECLGGIRPDPENPGFKHIIIRPYPVGGLSFVKTSHKSMYGLIVSQWKRERGRLVMDVTIPANTTASVWVPAKEGAGVTEGGAPASAARGVKFIRMEDDRAVFEVQPGSYSFAAGT
ncbi:MAG TPA: glycoside hydrolase family 78 protein [Bryobacteraceae bacterium]|nr:glycoside hydrolase family 78 protein [Bryobacteraceae bacterium]